MFYKLLSFILIYILSVINFTIVLLPLLLLIIPVILVKTNLIETESIIAIILLMLFLVSCVTNIIIIFDFIFGFSSRKFLKNTENCENLKDYLFLIYPFQEIKAKFNRNDVKLLISDSQDINAFAIGNMKKQYIVLTKGLITKYVMQLGTSEKLMISLKCIIGHEMSHLVNKDYLPTLLLEINEYSNRLISNILYKFFKIFINIFKIIPFFGHLFTYIFFTIYKIMNYLLFFFYKHIVLPIYKLIYLKISRTKEFRCDMQSALANGGLNMSVALSVLDDNGYLTLFSSHPKTKTRIKHIQNIKQSDDAVKPIFANSIINFCAIMLIIFLPLILFYLINFEQIIDNYNRIISNIREEIYLMKLRINMLLGL